MRYRVKIVLEERIIREQVYYLETDKPDNLLPQALIRGEIISDEEIDCIDSTIEEYFIEEVPVGN